MRVTEKEAQDWRDIIDSMVEQIREELKEHKDLNRALFNAAFVGYTPLLEELVNKGASITAEDAHGRNAACIYAQTHRYDDVPECLWQCTE